jgi:hypothetical protein
MKPIDRVLQMIGRVMLVVWLGMWPLLGAGAVFLFLSPRQGPRDPHLTGLQWPVVFLGGVVVLWLAFVAHQWLTLRRLAPFSITDRSNSPAPLPDRLVQADSELRRLGFTPVGQYEVDTAWPEKAPRVYAQYVCPENPGITADLSFTTSLTSFASHWAAGHALTTLYPRVDQMLPKSGAVFPRWMLVLHSGDSVEAGYQLHLNALGANERGAGKPMQVFDLATATALQASSMRRVHQFYRRQLWFPVSMTLFVVPAWLALAWFAFTY